MEAELINFKYSLTKNTMTTDQAKRVYQHLLKTGQAFCYFEGVLVDRQDCLEIILKSEPSFRS